MNRFFRSGRLIADPSGQPNPSAPRRQAFGLSRPVLLWAVVLAVTLLSFYVHLLNEQMLRTHVFQFPPAPLDARKARNTPLNMVRIAAADAQPAAPVASALSRQKAP